MRSLIIKSSSIIILIMIGSCVGRKQLPGASSSFAEGDTLPGIIKGNFIDDYEIEYSINDTVWIQKPNIRYHILKINRKEDYFIAHNGNSNPSEAGLYTRIDYVNFKGMAPFEWGFCLTTYNAINDSIAEYSAQADRLNPKKGCNGFPFSRMKRLTNPNPNVIP